MGKKVDYFSIITAVKLQNIINMSCQSFVRCSPNTQHDEVVGVPPHRNTSWRPPWLSILADPPVPLSKSITKFATPGGTTSHLANGLVSLPIYQP